VKQQEQKRSNGILTAVVVLLLVVIGVLLWLLLRPQPEPTKIPTGNVDVFDIRISCICKGEDGEECDDDDESTPGPEGYKGYSGSTINGQTDTNVDDDGIVYVDDKNGWYVYQKNLQIFQNAAFEYTNKIAPGVSNSYDFKVHNETKKSIRYNVQFEEESEYPVNMLYRLKRGGSYVVGDESTWVSANDLTVSALKILASDGIDTYTLDWKWPYEGGKDAADTTAGQNMTSEYSLGIKINFEEL
jgi:hypothetical protein